MFSSDLEEAFWMRGENVFKITRTSPVALTQPFYLNVKLVCELGMLVGHASWANHKSKNQSRLVSVFHVACMFSRCL